MDKTELIKLEERLETSAKSLKETGAGHIKTESESYLCTGLSAYLSYASSKELNKKIQRQQCIMILATVCLALFAGIQVFHDLKNGTTCDAPAARMEMAK